MLSPSLLRVAPPRKQGSSDNVLQSKKQSTRLSPIILPSFLPALVGIDPMSNVHSNRRSALITLATSQVGLCGRLSVLSPVSFSIQGS
jgi:hypothetical protein